MLFSLVIILITILSVPMLCRKLHIPAIVGFLLVGMCLGPYGLGWISKADSLDLLGRLGILYIMFQSGAEIDLWEVKRQHVHTIFFGLETFLIPFAAGVLIGHYALCLSWGAALLVGAMLGSHTLMTYPIVSRYGLHKNRAVGVTVGATMMATCLSLLVLAMVRNAVTADGVSLWWIGGKIVVMVGVVLGLIPLGVRSFMKRKSDVVAHFLLVLCAIAVSAFLSEWAGLDGILGAFLCGVALNRLLPGRSELMRRITFVGNTLFVPVFLLGVGMLINFKLFYADSWVILLTVLLVISKLAGKWIASWLLRHQMQLKNMERQMVFGLTHATAAGTLAIAIIGYHEGILDQAILNAAVLMILILCSTASFVTEHAAKQLALQAENDLSEPTDVALEKGEICLIRDWHSWTELAERVERETRLTAVYCERQPLNTVSRMRVAVPRYAEKEPHFLSCFTSLRRLANEYGISVIFYTNSDTKKILQRLCNYEGQVLSARFKEMEDWADVMSVKKDLRHNDMLVLWTSRKATPSYDPLFAQIPSILERFYDQCSWLLLYPAQQTGGTDMDAFLTDIPQASKTWSIVTWILDRFRRLQVTNQPTSKTSDRKTGI